MQRSSCSKLLLSTLGEEDGEEEDLKELVLLQDGVLVASSHGLRTSTSAFGRHFLQLELGRTTASATVRAARRC